MTPDAVSRGGTPEIRLEGKLPEDDTAKYAQARMAREGEVPLLPDRWIYDNILKIRDADNIEQAVSAQVARRGDAGVVDAQLDDRVSRPRRRRLRAAVRERAPAGTDAEAVGAAGAAGGGRA